MRYQSMTSGRLFLLMACCAALTLPKLWGGTPEAANAVAPPPSDNPLSFYNGELVFDFEERLRFDDRNNNYDFNSNVKSLTDGTWLLERTRVGMLVAPSDTLRFYVQGQSAYEFGDARPKIPGVMGAEGNDPANVRQAYVQIGPQNFNLTVGRQILAYGDERLVGPSDWNNFSRTFDAVKAHYAQDSWALDAFVSSVVVPSADQFDQSDLFDGNNTGRGQVFSGLYYTSTGLIPVQITDLYAFELHERDPGGDTDFLTLGTRMKADPSKLDGYTYETEMAAQTGKLGGKDLAAFGGHWGVGYVWQHTVWMPKLGLEYDYATGDANSKDGHVNTFQNLFPSNHIFYGNMDLFSWQNMQEVGVNLTANPCATLTAKLAFQANWLADTGDAWYRSNGTTQVRPITPGANPFLGTELDATLCWQPSKHLALQVSYNHFFAGSYLKDTGPSSDADFFYMMMTVRF